MKIVPIFDDYLYAAHFDGKSENEWDRNLELWGDVDYLKNFADQNGIGDVASFIDNIADQVDRLDDLLVELSAQGLDLDSFFKQLDDMETGDVTLSRRKGRIDKGKLRIYAIKIDQNCYVVTGGAIKMSYKMKDHPDTAKEIPKIEHVRDFLSDQNVIDKESFTDYKALE